MRSLFDPTVKIFTKILLCLIRTSLQTKRNESNGTSSVRFHLNLSEEIISVESFLLRNEIFMNEFVPTEENTIQPNFFGHSCARGFSLWSWLHCCILFQSYYFYHSYLCIFVEIDEFEERPNELYGSTTGHDGNSFLLDNKNLNILKYN